MNLTGLLSPVLNLPSIRHGFFTRQGGVSTGIYASLNCGPGSNDDPKAVRANRALVAARLQVQPDRVLSVHQVHGGDVLVLSGPHSGDRPKADAMVATTPGLALGVLAADCAPVLFASADGKVIGAAHAGWKGAFCGVLENTIAAMETLGAVRETISAAIGPCISVASYEVGPEFRQTLIGSDAKLDRFFVDSRQPDNFMFDLPGFVRHRLVTAGLTHIDCLNLDTYADPQRFFSYRRATHAGEPDYGRQISAIAINPLPVGEVGRPAGTDG